MVSTRHHPQDFPEPDFSSPTKPTPSKSTSAPSRTRKGKWAHTPSNLTLTWLFISLPLVTWDFCYCLLRPHSMPGGKLHWPLWTPYELYGRVDYFYGWKAYNEKDGFTGAQSFMNVIETLTYVVYLYMLYTYGKQSKAVGRGAPKKNAGWFGQQRYIDGREGAIAVLVGYSGAVMTVSKTVLYWMNEYYSGYSHIGHNDLASLFFLWIIPNGAWIVVPSYVAYVTGSEILQGLTIAAGGAVPSSDDTSLIKTE